MASIATDRYIDRAEMEEFVHALATEACCSPPAATGDPKAR